MSGDDDDGSVIIIQKAKAAANKPVTCKRWHLVALALVAFVAGAWIF